MTTLCFYRMTDDTGFAPNPFHGYCTVATCTPNHTRGCPRLGEGDFIVGIEGDALRKKRKRKRRQNQSSADGLCIIYFMKIDKKLTLNDYFNDQRFAEKKCNPNGSYVDKVGDNVYWQIDGHWHWTPGHVHDDHDDGGYLIKQDTCGNRVFISSGFSYFGDMGIPLPKALEEYVPPGKGTKYARDATGLVEELEDLGRWGRGRVGHPVQAQPDLNLNLSGTPAGCK